MAATSRLYPVLNVVEIWLIPLFVLEKTS